MQTEVVSGIHLAVDIDGTLVRPEKPFVFWYEQNHGINLSPYTTRQIREYVSRLGVDNPAETKKMMASFMSSEAFFNAPAFEGAKEVLADLDRRNYLEFITSRPLEYFNLLRTTILCIENNFPELTPPITLTQARGYDMGMPNSGLLTKGEICRDRSIAVLIDNSLAHAESCVKNGIKVVLFDPGEEHPTHELPQEIERVTCWGEVPEAIHRLLGAA